MASISEFFVIIFSTFLYCFSGKIVNQRYLLSQFLRQCAIFARFSDHIYSNRYWKTLVFHCRPNFLTIRSFILIFHYLQSDRDKLSTGRQYSFLIPCLYSFSSRILGLIASLLWIRDNNNNNLSIFMLEHIQNSS